MHFSPKSSYKDHDIHSWYGSSDDGKRLNTCRKKCNEIVPISKSCDKSPNPLYTQFDPFWSYERYNNKDKRQYSKKDRKKFRESFYDFFE